MRPGAVRCRVSEAMPRSACTSRCSAAVLVGPGHVAGMSTVMQPSCSSGACRPTETRALAAPGARFWITRRPLPLNSRCSRSKSSSSGRSNATDCFAAIEPVRNSSTSHARSCRSAAPKSPSGRSNLARARPRQRVAPSNNGHRPPVRPPTSRPSNAPLILQFSCRCRQA